MKRVLQLFQKASEALKAGETMDIKTFESFLCKLFEVGSVAEDGVEQAYSVSKAADGSIAVEKFLQWYRDNMFTMVASLTASSDRQEVEDKLREAARKFMISRVDIEKIKKVFDKFDLDKSGLIEFIEFEQMMCHFLNVKDKTDIPVERMNRFFKEVDQDGSGEVDFEEFSEWFLKYFASSDSLCPVDSFYASHMPDVQRRNCLFDSNH